MDAMIYCKDGQCKFVNPTELLLNQSEEELGGFNQVQWGVSKPERVGYSNGSTQTKMAAILFLLPFEI